MLFINEKGRPEEFGETCPTIARRARNRWNGNLRAEPRTAARKVYRLGGGGASPVITRHKNPAALRVER